MMRALCSHTTGPAGHSPHSHTRASAVAGPGVASKGSTAPYRVTLSPLFKTLYAKLRTGRTLLRGRRADAVDVDASDDERESEHGLVRVGLVVRVRVS